MPHDFHERGGMRGGSSHDRLTDTQKYDLRQMRKRQKTEHRKKKIIKLDDEGVRGKWSGDVIMSVLRWMCGDREG